MTKLIRLSLMTFIAAFILSACDHADSSETLPDSPRSFLSIESSSEVSQLKTALTSSSSARSSGENQLIDHVDWTQVNQITSDDGELVGYNANFTKSTETLRNVWFKKNDRGQFDPYLIEILGADPSIQYLSPTDLEGTTMRLTDLNSGKSWESSDKENHNTSGRSFCYVEYIWVETWTTVETPYGIVYTKEDPELYRIEVCEDIGGGGEPGDDNGDGELNEDGGTSGGGNGGMDIVPVRCAPNYEMIEDVCVCSGIFLDGECVVESEGIDCNSFNFTELMGGDWQETGVRNIRFRQVIYDASTGKYYTKSFTIRKTVYFGLPKVKFSGAQMPAGEAASISAAAVQHAMDLVHALYMSNPETPSAAAISQFMSYLQSFMISRGGRADYHGSGVTVPISDAQYTIFGNGDCD